MNEHTKETCLYLIEAAKERHVKAYAVIENSHMKMDEFEKTTVQLDQLALLLNSLESQIRHS